jgi:hypothetical protein
MALLAKAILTLIAGVLFLILLASIYFDYKVIGTGVFVFTSGTLTNTDVFTVSGPNTACDSEKCGDISSIAGFACTVSASKTLYTGTVTSATESNDQITIVLKLDSPPSSYSYNKGDYVTWGRGK